MQRETINGLAAVALTLSAAGPASGQVVRVSVSSEGVESNGHSYGGSMSASGRFTVFYSDATNLVADDTNAVTDVFLRDRDTDGDGIFDEAGAVSTTRISVGPGGSQANGGSQAPVMAADGRFVVFVSGATNLVAGGVAASFLQVYRLDRQTGTTTLVSANASGEPSDGNCIAPATSGDGRYIVFTCITRNLISHDSSYSNMVLLRDMETGALTRLSAPRPPATLAVVYGVGGASISRDGRVVAFAETESRRTGLGNNPFVYTGLLVVLDRASGAAIRTGIPGVLAGLSADGSRFFTFQGGGFLGSGYASWHHTTLGESFNLLGGQPIFTRLCAVSDDGRHAVLSSGNGLMLYDAAYRRGFDLPYATGGVALAEFDAAARWLAFTSYAANVPIAGGDANGSADVFVADLRQVFDQDNDTLDDRDEMFYGLSTGSGSGADGPAGDPDADGLTNAQEIAAGTHPRGFVKRYLAEGATGPFFRTRIALANPDADNGASAVLRFSRGDGAVVGSPLAIEAGRRVTLNPAVVPGLEWADFSTLVESDRPVVIDRTMSWDARSPLVPSGYGAHTETAVDAPATAWYLAEGSTVLDFQLFYLLQNPQEAPVEATVRYLRPSGPAIVKTYQLAAHSRTTIYVNQADPALAGTDVSAAIESTAPIIVERAMYANRPGQVFALGHASKGVTAPADRWFLAEGATGAFFDTYVLIANPSATSADIEARFDRPDGSSMVRTFTLAANSRHTIFVDAIPGLEATTVATAVTSTNAVPVIVERAMYWPNGFFEYYEGHSSAGTTTTGTRWALAEGESGGPRNAQTYVLIANTSSSAGRVRITPLWETIAMTALEMDLPPNSRTTVPMTAALSSEARFGVLVESVGADPVPIVVEGAFYWTVDGVLWAAGSNVVATKLP